MTTYSSTLGSSSANCKLMVMMSQPPPHPHPATPYSVGNGLWLWVKRWAHVLHTEPGLQHLPTWDHLPGGPPGLRKAQPSLWVCGDGNRWWERAALGHHHGSREDGKHQRRGPWVFPACVSTIVTHPSALLAFFCHCCLQKWGQITDISVLFTIFSPVLLSSRNHLSSTTVAVVKMFKLFFSWQDCCITGTYVITSHITDHPFCRLHTNHIW